MSIEVREVSSKPEWRQFLKLPLAIYQGNRNYVPHLLWERREFFSSSNPIFEFTEPRYFIARDMQGNVVGRISAHINRRHNEFWGERTGFFGFFESSRNIEVAQALMRRAEQCLFQRGMSLIRGPCNFSTNEECGFLVRGFQEPPVFMMPYTHSYYPRFMDILGYHKAKDLYAYDYKCSGQMPQFLERPAKRIQHRTNMKVRTIRMDEFAEDVERAFSIYNSAWQHNWGFVPMSEAQFTYMANTLKSIIDPDLAVIAEKDGEAVGFCLGLPDYNVLFRRMHGRLFPMGLLYLLFGRCLIQRARVITFGVIEEYRRRGVDVLLLHRILRNGIDKGCLEGEFSWVLEDNVDIQRIFVKFGAVHYKTYRIYEKML